ncbi:hypothetical protein C922_02668 [Plasmodium inui San Antonio 1]|uniref:PH domain-containing protein n=1 Tax=Plasmodium inui San Antonio 1 TaxID=1237626 RepID=W7ADG4_9APIC|nr:hypothetical protein C922_02668 [Plasmodium inui San Antonio 1]EUD67084.1 hypothetical protein C922_02668 [Plasmodium inui San Antonio 1]
MIRSVKSKVTLSLAFFLLTCLSPHGKANCQSLLPVSYATHQLYSFDKLTPVEVKNDLKKTLGSFITRKLKDLQRKFYDYKGYGNHGRSSSDEQGEGLRSDYDASLEEEVKALLGQAQNKRYLSKRIKDSHDRALKNLKRSSNEEGSDEEKTRKLLKHNLEQINYLNKKSHYLESKAEELKRHLKSGNNKNYNYEQQGRNCDIYKTGKLKFVSSSNGLKHSIDKVQGRINNSGFTIFYKNKKKMTYLWNSLELPIKLIGSVEQCFLFVYKNNNQILCTENKLKTASWVNSLAEASTCYHFGIRGRLVNTNNIKSVQENLDKNRKKDAGGKLLVVDLKPEEETTRVFVNNREQNVQEGYGGVIDLNQIKKNMEEEKKQRRSTRDEVPSVELAGAEGGQEEMGKAQVVDQDASDATDDIDAADDSGAPTGNEDVE